jgi:hypothetical protein
MYYIYGKSPDGKKTMNSSMLTASGAATLLEQWEQKNPSWKLCITTYPIIIAVDGNSNDTIVGDMT